MPSPAPARPRRWWGAAPDPALAPISTRRAYAEVLLVFAAFFLSGVVSAVFLLAGRNPNPKTASWSTYLPASFDVVAQAGLAVAVVLLLSARRGVTPQALGLSWPRRGDGRTATAPMIRILGWALLAQIVGGVINGLLQSGHLPTETPNGPELMFASFRSLNAGVVEEMVVLAFVVVTLRQARRPWWEVTAVALVLRGSYHIYYGPGVVGILVWAALFYWIYLRTRNLWMLMVSHVAWDVVSFFSQRWVAVGVVGFFVTIGIWLTGGITWLSERNSRPSSSAPVEVTVPPGWQPDPSGMYRWRWWDGQRWTQHVA